MRTNAIKRIFGAYSNGPSLLDTRGSGAPIARRWDDVWELATEKVFERLGDARWYDSILARKDDLMSLIAAKYPLLRNNDVLYPKNAPRSDTGAWAAWERQESMYEAAVNDLVSLILAELIKTGFLSPGGRVANPQPGLSATEKSRYEISDKIDDYVRDVSRKYFAEHGFVNLNWNDFYYGPLKALKAKIDSVVNGTLSLDALKNEVENATIKWIQEQGGNG